MLYCTVDPMLLPSGNPIKCHEEILSWQPNVVLFRFDNFSLSGGTSEGFLDAFRFFFQNKKLKQIIFVYYYYNSLLCMVIT